MHYNIMHNYHYIPIHMAPENKLMNIYNDMHCTNGKKKWIL